MKKLLILLLLLPSALLAEITDWTIPTTLPSKDKQKIMMGLTCCYHEELINNVRMENSPRLIEHSSREKVRRSISSLQYSEPITNGQWLTFITLQMLDIHSTYKGLQWDCVYEMNPIMGKVPSLDKVFVTKSLILSPAIIYDLRKGTLTPKIMNQLNFIMYIVVYNNYNVYTSARSSTNCSKR